MKKMEMSKSDFEDIVFEFCESHYEDVYVVFKAAYRKVDLAKESYMFEHMEFDGNQIFHSWDNDWDEGQEYIDFYGCFTEADLLNLILMQNSIDLIKKRLLETAFNHVGVLCDGSELLEDIESRIDYWLKGNENDKN